MSQNANKSAVIVFPKKLKKRAQKYLIRIKGNHDRAVKEIEGNKRRGAWKTIIVKRMIDIMAEFNCEMSEAVDIFHQRIEQGMESSAVTHAAASLARKGERAQSRATLYRDLKKYRREGEEALITNHGGRVPEWYDWMPDFMEMWMQPTKLLASTIALELRKAGHDSCTNDRAQAFARRLKADLGKNCKERVGEHFHEQNIKPSRLIDNDVLPVGFMYEGDGHSCKFYCKHPITGRHFKPELVAWIDRRSRKIVGWWLGSHEKGILTLASLSRAMLVHDHVPSVIHVDPGSGFKNRMMDHQAAGWLTKYSIRPSYARAGNARGKGMIENLWKHVIERVAKKLPTYCGRDRTDKALEHLTRKIARGEIEVPDFSTVVALLEEFVNDWNSEAKPALGGLTPDQVWEQGLDQRPVVTEAAAVIRPRVERTVQRWRVQIDNRKFQDPDFKLAAYEGEKVLVEYDYFSWDRVWIFSTNGMPICEAEWVEKDPAMSASRIEDDNQRSAIGVVKRIETRKQELLARLEAKRDPTKVTDEIYHLEQHRNDLNDLHAAGIRRAAAGGQAAERADDDDAAPEIDIYSTDY